MLEGGHRMDAGCRLIRGYDFNYEHRAAPMKVVEPSKRVLPETSTFYQLRPVTVYTCKGDSVSIELEELKSLSSFLQEEADRTVKTTSISSLRALVETVRGFYTETSLPHSAAIMHVYGEDVNLVTISNLKETICRYVFRTDPFRNSVSIIAGQDFATTVSNCQKFFLSDDCWDPTTSGTWTNVTNVRFVIRSAKKSVFKYPNTGELLFNTAALLDVKEIVEKHFDGTKVTSLDSLRKRGADPTTTMLIADFVTLFTFWSKSIDSMEKFASSIPRDKANDMADTRWLAAHVFFPCHCLAEIVSYYGYKSIFAKTWKDPEKKAYLPLSKEELGNSIPNENFKDESNKFAKNCNGRSKLTRDRYYNIAYAAFIMEYLEFIADVASSTDEVEHMILPALANDLKTKMLESVTSTIKTPGSSRKGRKSKTGMYYMHVFLWKKFHAHVSLFCLCLFHNFCLF